MTNPPLISNLSAEEISRIADEPLKCEIPCHSQTVEHTVALVTKATQGRRTEDNQLMSVFQIAQARKDYKGTVTHKRYREKPVEESVSGLNAVKKGRPDSDGKTPFESVLFMS